ncbi:hypothetical protein PUN28_014072 [Cardiocondyla obscurior]|uniref:Uncharacterized protein n=1 Tax=Cardiocondyla obscurior TaxID=286306 RepID=A0AAW2F9J1_9HYME
MTCHIYKLTTGVIGFTSVVPLNVPFRRCLARHRDKGRIKRNLIEAHETEERIHIAMTLLDSTSHHRLRTRAHHILARRTFTCDGRSIIRIPSPAKLVAFTVVHRCEQHLVTRS